MARKLILVRGLPGSGKSTYAKTLTWREVREADNYFIDSNGVYLFDSRKLPEAHLNCLLFAYEELNIRGEDSNVVVANTFSTLWEMRQYIALATLMDTEVEVHKCVGQFQNIHGVPPEAVSRMAARWEDFEGEIVVQPPIE